MADINGFHNSAAQIQDRIQSVQNITIDDTFQKLEAEAGITKKDAVARLRESYKTAKEREDSEAETERLKAEKEAQEKEAAKLKTEKEAQEKEIARLKAQLAQIDQDFIAIVPDPYVETQDEPEIYA